MTRHIRNAALPLISLTGLAAGAALAAGPEPGTLEYGPTQEEVQRDIRPGQSIQGVIGRFGAPYAVYPVGQGSNIYRWGHGSDKMEGDKISINHYELLVTADAVGNVTAVSYKPKYIATIPAAILAGSSGSSH